MDCGIYKIENLINNKIYIGSSININDRKYKHFWMLRKNIHDNNHLQNSYNKFGEENFNFGVLELCDINDLVTLENKYIELYKADDLEFGYNLAKVNEFRRNTFNDTVKLKLSRYNLNKNGNIKNFMLTEISNNKCNIFDNLFDAARYLINGGFTNGSERNVRQKLSSSLRGKTINNGYKGSIRKTIYKHEFKLIN
jgi:group I intron endonuclease